MNSRAFALLLAVGFGLVGIAGFVPGLIHTIHIGAPPLAVSQGYGLVLGLFPVNVLHNLVHLFFAAFGFLAYLGVWPPVSYARVVAVAYGLLMVMGLIPGLNTVFGLVPIYGADVALHAVIAAAAAYFGFAARASVLGR
jgi:hypothetical protein